MYYNFTVSVPSVQGKIIRKKKGGATYILFQYGQTYNKEKQNAVPNRTIIGKVDLSNENAGQYYPDFVFCHPLFSDGMRISSDSKISRFLNSVTKDQIIGFLNDWNKKRDHKQRIYISYDSSNKNCQAGDIDLVEYGKARDDKGLPFFNIVIVYDKTNRVPLFYEEYPGPITDVSLFVHMVDKVSEYGYKKVGFILDRGYFSKENIRYMESGNYAFIIMVKGQKELVSSLVAENRNSFETDRECRICSYSVYGKTVRARLYGDDSSDRWFHMQEIASLFQSKLRQERCARLLRRTKGCNP